MELAVVGANGRTGAAVLRQALNRGYDVRALVRRPETMRELGAAVRVHQTDVLDEGSVRAAVAGCDAVISTIGVGTSRAPTTVYSDGVRSLLAAMDTAGISRLSVVSAAPAGPRQQQAPLSRWVLYPVLERFFGASYVDMRQMERILAGSATDWVCLRPPYLMDKSSRGYRVDHRRPLSGSLTFADLATALLDSLDRPQWRRVPQYVAR